MPNYKWTDGKSVADNFTDIGVYLSDIVKEVNNGQETTYNDIEKGVTDAISVGDPVRGHLTDIGSSSGSNTISGSGFASIADYFTGDAAREIVDAALGINQDQSTPLQISFPTPDSFLYFINSLPEGGTGVYGNSVYLNKEGAVTLLGDTSILDNDPGTNAYYDPANDAVVGNGIAPGISAGAYFNYNDITYVKGSGDSYYIADLTDNDGNYIPPTSIAYFESDPDGNNPQQITDSIASEAYNIGSDIIDAGKSLVDGILADFGTSTNSLGTVS